MDNRICAVVVNDHGDILPYTCQSTKQGTEEWAEKNLPGWEEMKRLGAKVVQARLTLEE